MLARSGQSSPESSAYRLYVVCYNRTMRDVRGRFGAGADRAIGVWGARSESRRCALGDAGARSSGAQSPDRSHGKHLGGGVLWIAADVLSREARSEVLI